MSYIGAGKLYSGIGKSDFMRESDHDGSAPRARSPRAPRANPRRWRSYARWSRRSRHRRVARGEDPLDVDAEIAELTAPPPAVEDPALREEVRQLVVARNARRARKGEPPLDVEAEVERQLRDLT